MTSDGIYPGQNMVDCRDRELLIGLVKYSPMGPSLRTRLQRKGHHELEGAKPFRCRVKLDITVMRACGPSNFQKFCIL